MEACCGGRKVRRPKLLCMVVLCARVVKWGWVVVVQFRGMDSLDIVNPSSFVGEDLFLPAEQQIPRAITPRFGMTSL
jgi:hypothetical protein